MRTILAIMIIVLLLAGIAVFTLPVTGAPLSPDQPLLLSITDSSGDSVPHIACTGQPCDCQTC